MMTHAATFDGKVICFKCRSSAIGSCRCEAPSETQQRYSVTTPMLGLWLAGAAIAGSFLGAALALLH